MKNISSCYMMNIYTELNCSSTMFTGIIEGVGTVEKITQNTKNRSAFQMTVAASE